MAAQSETKDSTFKLPKTASFQKMNYLYLSSVLKLQIATINSAKSSTNQTQWHAPKS